MEIASLIIGIVDDADQPSLWRASCTAWFEGQIRKIFLCWRREKLFLQSPIDKGVNLDDKHSYQLASGYNLEPSNGIDAVVPFEGVKDMLALEPSSCKRLFCESPLGFGPDHDIDQNC